MPRYNLLQYLYIFLHPIPSVVFRLFLFYFSGLKWYYRLKSSSYHGEYFVVKFVYCLKCRQLGIRFLYQQAY
jgi:hypothetical protein